MFKKSTTSVRPFKLALLAMAIGVAAQAHAASTTATASATVIAPIGVSSTGSLAFGKIAAAATPGSITVSTNGTRTASVASASGTASAVTFDITGEANATYTIDTSATTNLTSGSDSMTLALVSDFSGAGATTGVQGSGTLDGTGKQTLHVGGTLTVGANQPAGAYTGTVSVAVAYN